METTVWGLPCSVTPCVSARLVQEGNRLHFLADRMTISGQFSAALAQAAEAAFPVLISELEQQLADGQLDPRQQRCVRLQHGDFLCDADTLGSCGYVYIAIWPVSAG